MSKNAENQISSTRFSTNFYKINILLLIVLCFWLSNRLLFFEGFHGSDDFNHIRFAYFWHSLPQDHWEVRLPYNGLLFLSFKIFGFGESSAAIPGMLGSLLIIIAAMWIAFHRWKSYKMVLLVGLLFAYLPSDVIDCTTAAASKTLATGILALGIVFLLCGSKKLSAFLSGIFFAISIFTHLSVIFFVVIFLSVFTFLDKSLRRNCIIALSTTFITFYVLNLVIFGTWTGDPFYQFKLSVNAQINSPITIDSRSILKNNGQLDWKFFWRPLKDLLVSKLFGIYGALVIIGSIFTWEKRNKLSRNLILTIIMFWAWMSYGTYCPARYIPFPGTTLYWQPLGLLFALILGDLLLKINQRLLLIAMIILITSNTILMSLSGAWGQNIEISKELLIYTKKHPQNCFVTDNKTIKEMMVLNEFKEISNVYPTINSDGPTFVTISHKSLRDCSNTCYIMINPLNKLDDDASYQWINQHRGKIVFKSNTEYRLLTYLFPLRFITANKWTIRKPPAEVYECIY